jgi:PAS domain S-box-containing protein
MADPLPRAARPLLVRPDAACILCDSSPACCEGEVSKDIGSSVLAPTPLSDIATSARERDELLSLAEQSAGIGVWDIDMRTGTTRGTEQFFRIMGLQPTAEPISMERIRAIRHPDDRAKVVDGFRRALDSGQDSYEVEYRIIHPDGAVRWIFGRGRVVRDAAGTPIRYSGVDIDITERKKTEAALAELNRELEERVRERTDQLEAEAAKRVQAETLLLQAQKMEAVGQLTGGIAHDFNNLLTVIIGNLENLRRRISRNELDPPELGRLTDQALAGAQRASRLTQHLLAFARRQPLEPRSLNVNTLLSGMSDLLKRTLGEGVEVRTVLAEELWACFVDANQLEVALLNLAVNARHAMAKGGTLTIESRNVAYGARAAATSEAGLVPGDYVVLSVTDTGHGMSKQVLERVFEPFFTTKGIGEGTGLGLSQVYGFAKQSGGGVEIDSEEGKGTTVRLYLPRLAQEVAEPVPPTAAAPAPRAAKAETVLVVEDEFLLRLISVEALSELGYQVLEAADAAQALDVLAREPDIALMFSDIGLPGMNGCELALEVRRRYPQVKLLLTSGYAEQALLRDGRWDSSIPLLHKPYNYQTLSAKLREVLEPVAAK